MALHLREKGVGSFPIFKSPNSISRVKNKKNLNGNFLSVKLIISIFRPRIIEKINTKISILPSPNLRNPFFMLPWRSKVDINWNTGRMDYWNTEILSAHYSIHPSFQ
jgi:hypothetical protein